MFNFDLKARITDEHAWGVSESKAMTRGGVFQTVLHGPCTIQFSCNNGIAYPDLHDPPMYTSSPGKGAVFKLL